MSWTARLGRRVGGVGIPSRSGDPRKFGHPQASPPEDGSGHRFIGHTPSPRDFHRSVVADRLNCSLKGLPGGRGHVPAMSSRGDLRPGDPFRDPCPIYRLLLRVPRHHGPSPRLVGVVRERLRPGPDLPTPYSCPNPPPFLLPVLKGIEGVSESLSLGRTRLSGRLGSGRSGRGSGEPDDSETDHRTFRGEGVRVFRSSRVSVKTPRPSTAPPESHGPDPRPTDPTGPEWDVSLGSGYSGTLPGDPSRYPSSSRPRPPSRTTVLG